MKLCLNEKVPVQESYIFIPGPLYKELKDYIEDLLNEE